MKLFFRISLLTGTLFLTSCLSTTFYQIYKTTASGKTILKDGSLNYEDDNCIISYDLWSEGGDIGFVLTNKTDKNIHLNLEETFFILNGIAHDYYLNRVFTATENSAATIAQSSGFSRTGFNNSPLLQTGSRSLSTGMIKSLGYSVAYNEDKVITIPAHSAKRIEEYAINQSQYRDCDLYKYPSRKQITSATFTKSNSPLVFSNRITYWVEGSQTPVKLENEFYVTEITNLPEAEATTSDPVEFCEQKGMTSVKNFKDVTPDKFYFKYTRKQDYFTH